MSVTASEARRRLVSLIEEVNENRIAVEIVSEHGAVFLVPGDEYRSLTETVHLLRSPRNAERLRSSLVEIRPQAVADQPPVDRGGCSRS